MYILTMTEFSALLTISLINNTGLRTLPCGTPLVTAQYVHRLDSVLTHCISTLIQDSSNLHAMHVNEIGR